MLGVQVEQVNEERERRRRGAIVGQELLGKLVKELELEAHFVPSKALEARR